MTKTLTNPLTGDALHIKQNGQEREVCMFGQLTEEVRAEFDYITEEEFHDNRFFNYRGSWYDLQDGFMPTPGNLATEGWHGVQGESYFSAVLVKYFDADDNYLGNDGASIRVGYAHW